MEFYDSGFGGDFGGNFGGYDPQEEERRRRREQQQQQQQQSPYQLPTDEEKTQPRYQNQSPNQQQQQEPERDQRPQQDTRTFAQRQAAGEARPAPPVPPAVAPYAPVQQPVLQYAPDLAGQAGPSGPDGPMSGTAPGMGGDAGNVGGSTRPPDEAVMYRPPMPVLLPAPAGVSAAGVDPLKVAQNTVTQNQFNVDMLQRMGGTLNPDGSSTWTNVEVPVANPPAYKGGQTPPPDAPNGSTFLSDQGVTWTKRGRIWVVEAVAGKPNNGMPTGYAALAPDALANQNAATLGARTGLSQAGLDQFVRQYGAPTSPAQMQTLANNLTNVQMPETAKRYDPTKPPGEEYVQDTPFSGNLADYLRNLPSGGGMGAGAGPGGPASGGSNTGMGNAGPETEAAPAERWTGTMPVSYGEEDYNPREEWRRQRREQDMANMGVSSQGLNPLRAAAAAGVPTPPPAPESGSTFVRDRLNAALDNPSAFDNEEVMKLYERLGMNIDDQFSQQQTQLREEMARRGLADSSIQGGRLSDLNVAQRQARTELADRLATARAQDFANARNTLLGLGLQQQGQDNAFTLGSRGMDLQQIAQANNYALGLGGLDMQGRNLDAQVGQNAFTNDLSTAQFNRLLQNDQDMLMLKLLGLGG